MNMCKLDSLAPSEEDVQKTKEILEQMSSEEIVRRGIIPDPNYIDTIEALLHKRYYCGGTTRAEEILIKESELIDLLKKYQKREK